MALFMIWGNLLLVWGMELWSEGFNAEVLSWYERLPL